MVAVGRSVHEHFRHIQVSLTYKRQAKDNFYTCPFLPIYGFFGVLFNNIINSSGHTRWKVEEWHRSISIRWRKVIGKHREHWGRRIAVPLLNKSPNWTNLFSTLNLHFQRPATILFGLCRTSYVVLLKTLSVPQLYFSTQSWVEEIRLGRTLA